MDHLLHLTTNRLLIFIFLSMICGQVYADTTPWNGNIADKIVNKGGNKGETAEYPILIATAEELAYLAQQTNTGGKELILSNGTSITGASYFKDLYFRLTANIDLGNKKWTAIGTSDNTSKFFKGNFDGDDHTISNVKIDDDQNYHLGIFGYIKDATIENLHVIVSEDGIKGQGYSAYVGGIAGYSRNSIIRKCDVTGGSITGNTNDFGSFSNTYVGGIVGFNDNCSIDQCFATCDIVAQELYQPLAGGITSSNFGTTASVSNCYYYGKVTCLDGSYGYAGGIVGSNTSGTISNCYSYAQVTALYMAGGITAQNGSGGSIQICCTKTMENRAVTFESIINAPYAGGIAGGNYSKITNCYSLAKVTGTYAGGIAGTNTQSGTSISYCYAAGKVTATDYSGGIAGLNDKNAVISHCLALNIDGIGDETATKGRIANASQNDLEANYASPLIEGEWSNKDYNLPDGEDLTSTNFNNSPKNALENWVTSIWDNLDNEYLPVFKGTGSIGPVQPNIPKYSYIQYTIKYDQPANGSISVKYTDAGGQEQDVPSGSNISVSMELVITAIPSDATTHELESLTVNGNDFISGNTHTVSGDVEIIASFKEKPAPEPTPTPDPDPVLPPTVYHTVTLPAVEGATTDPVAGDYEVEAWSSFRFYLTLEEGYNQSEPVVTTDRGETITPRSSDGAYIIKYIRQPLEILIDGIAKNPAPVGNEAIATDGVKVWKTEHYLHIQAPTDGQGYIYTPEGKLQTVCKLIAGEVKTIQLPTGIYFVRIGKEQFKVVL